MNTDDKDDVPSDEFAFQTAADEILELPEAGPEDDEGPENSTETPLYTRRSPAMLALAATRARACAR